jgi:hypothetical protein
LKTSKLSTIEYHISVVSFDLGLIVFIGG